MTEEPIANQIRRALRNLTIATIAVYLALALVFAFAWIDSSHRRAELEQVALSTNTALCALRSDLERRITTSELFLRENPDGIPGLSADVIRQSLENQRQTVTALSILDCSLEGGTP